MTGETLSLAMQRAKVFLQLAKAAQDRILADEYALTGCRETAAVKRASMDLTRALAAMRRPS